LVNPSSGNSVLYIAGFAGYRPAWGFDSQEHDTNQSRD